MMIAGPYIMILHSTAKISPQTEKRCAQGKTLTRIRIEEEKTDL